MPSNPQLKLMTDLLHLEGVIVANYQIIAELGVVLHLKITEKQATCTCCGNKSSKLYQNNELTIRDLPWGDQTVYLKTKGEARIKKSSKSISFDHRTTQITVEGVNNKLKAIKRRGYGFRIFQNFSIRCLLT